MTDYSLCVANITAAAINLAAVAYWFGFLMGARVEEPTPPATPTIKPPKKAKVKRG